MIRVSLFVGSLIGATRACAWALILFAGLAGLAQAADKPAEKPAEKEPAKKAEDDGWKSIFDGKSLEGWKTADFGGQAEPKVKDGQLVLGAGASISGVVYTGKTPKVDYEISLEAQRVDGSDFFVGLTFPVVDSHASLVCGGWGGSLVGISSIDGMDAANNNTTKMVEFENKKWYRIRVRVLKDRLQAWIDDKQVVDADIEGHKVDTRIDIDNCKPFGLGSYQTTAAYKNIKIKALDMEELDVIRRSIKKDE